MKKPKSFNKLFNEYGQKSFTYTKDYYNRNKILIWIIILVIITGILPIFPTISTEFKHMEIPYIEDQYNNLKYGIEIRNECGLFYFWDELNRLDLRNMEVHYYPQSKKLNVLEHKFRDYKIAIFGIKACTSCIDDNSISLLSPKTCQMNSTSIFGFFEKCKSSYDEYNRKTDSCIKYPFVLSDNVQVVSPDNSFKLTIKPYVTKNRIKGERFNPVINLYSVDLVIDYPDYKPLPYIKWIGSLLLFILDPLKSVLKYFMDNWFYK